MSPKDKEREVMVQLASICRGTPLEKATYGEMADEMLIHMKDLGYGLFNVIELAKRLEN